MARDFMHPFDPPDPVRELLSVERQIGALGERLRQLRRESAERDTRMGERAYKVTLIRAAYGWLLERLTVRQLQEPTATELLGLNREQLANNFVDWLDQKGSDRGED